MKISIVTPHFNRADLLADTIKSVRAQSRSDWELIVVDDRSDPAHWEKIQALAGPQIKVLQRIDGIKGPSRCRNLGLKAATGEYIFFLDSDDLLAPWCVTQRLDAAATHPHADLWVFPVLLFIKSAGDSDLQWNVLENSRADLDRFLQSDPPWHTSSSLWQREKLISLGGFNEAVFYGDDADLHIRALVTGLKVQKITQALPDVFIRRSEEARITNSFGPALIESRRVRLEQGSQFLQQARARAEFLLLWEGQYFVEAEFLLFNVDDSRAAIQRILLDWQQRFQVGGLRKLLVTTYFHLALACRKNAYFLLRLARRLAMKLLPAEFFPRGGVFQSARLAVEKMQIVRSKL